MTDAPIAVGRARRAPSAGVAPRTWLGALAVFAVVLGLLAWRMAGGNDPALGTQHSPAATPPAKQVVIRRIVRRTIVVTRGAPVRAGASPRPARVVATPPPAASAPAAAPAPVTRSS